MAEAIYTVVLDLTDNGCIQTGWRLKQGDSGNSTIVAKIVNNGVDAYDPSATPDIAFKRADGNSVLSTMTAVDGYYNYTFVGNELAIPGQVVMDVTFTDSESKISTASCKFEVVEDPAGYDPSGAHTYDNPVSALVEQATLSAEQAIQKSEDSEAWAKGTRNGDPVPSTDPTYHNNAKYWSEQANPTAFANMSDVDFDNLQNGQVPVYNSTSGKWENGAGGGGSSTLAGLLDVDISLPTDGQALVYDDVNDKWINGNVGGASLPIDISDNVNKVTGILKTANGGTGNSDGYIRKGQTLGFTIGTNATAEGSGNVAYGTCSHAEGSATRAFGNFSHAEGYDTEANGLEAHAEGIGTIAKGDYSHAQGQYNIQDNNQTYAHIVGNGTADNARSNAHTLDWSGNAWFAGNVTDGSGNKLSDVANKHKVSNFEVSTTGWTSDTTSQSGTTLYKKQVTLSHVYAHPSVDIGASTGNVLPTTAEQAAYDLVQYVTVDDTVPCLYLYASDTPTSAFNIDVEGVD